MKICYHGTNKTAADSILKKGFKRRTYFAQHLEDALGFGGLHIFEVALGDEVRGFDWQFMLRRNLHPKHIVRYAVYKKPKLVLENKKLGEKVFRSNLETEKGHD